MELGAIQEQGHEKWTTLTFQCHWRLWPNDGILLPSHRPFAWKWYANDLLHCTRPRMSCCHCDRYHDQLARNGWKFGIDNVERREIKIWTFFNGSQPYYLPSVGSLQETITFLEQEMVIDELLLNGFFHTRQGVEFSFQFTIQSAQCWLDFFFHFFVLSLGQAWIEWVSCVARVSEMLLQSSSKSINQFIAYHPLSVRIGHGSTQ